MYLLTHQIKMILLLIRAKNKCLVKEANWISLIYFNFRWIKNSILTPFYF
jgi:hypothetical protein